MRVCSICKCIIQESDEIMDNENVKVVVERGSSEKTYCPICYRTKYSVGFVGMGL